MAGNTTKTTLGGALAANETATVTSAADRGA